MKLRYLFSMIIASVLLFAGCAKEASTDSFDNIKLDETYLVIPEAGGTVTLKVNATDAWKIDTTYTQDVWPNVITRKKNDAGELYVSKVVPSWLSVDKMAGEDGETVLSFTADQVSGGRELELCIKAGVNSQFLRVRQGSLEAASATCAEINAGPDGKTYKVKGTVTSIVNTTYGNWYLQDETGEVYIYGTLDKDGKTKNFLSLGLEVGDVVEVQGPKTTYGSTVELVDVTVLSIKKAYAKLITDPKTISKDGEQFDVKVAYKGEGLFPSVPEDFRSWVSILDVQSKPGIATKIEPNPADTAIVTVSVAPNKSAYRTGSIVLTSATTSLSYNFSQDGSVLEIEDGYYWLISGNVAASPVPANKKYGYLGVAEATATTAPGASAFSFKAVEGGYTIQDLSGRYYYMQGTYDNFNVSATLPAEGHVWTIYASDDNTVMIMNNMNNKFIQFDSNYNSWGAYATQKGTLPALVTAVAQVIADGKYYIEVSAGVATPLATSKNYGYVNVAAKAEANAFTFTFTEGEGYTICDSNNRYYYQKGTYNSFNLSTNPTEGQYWSIVPQEDGTVKIINRSVNKWWQYSTSYKSFGSYAEAQSGAELPKLVAAE